MQDLLDQIALRKAKVVGVRGRNQISGNVIDAVEVQNVAFHIHQIAFAQPFLPEPARNKQHVDVTFIRPVDLHACASGIDSAESANRSIFRCK